MEVVFEKKSKAQKHMMQCCAVDIFPENALGDGPTFWIFPQDLRIKVKKRA